MLLGSFQGHSVPDPCPTPLCQTRTRMEAAPLARSVDLNPAIMMATANVWPYSVSSLFLRMLLGSAFRLQCAGTHKHTHAHTHIHIYIQETQTCRPLDPLSRTTYVYAVHTCPHSIATTPINAHFSSHTQPLD